MTDKKGKQFSAWKKTTETKIAKKLAAGKYRVQVRAVNTAGFGKKTTSKFRVKAASSATSSSR